MSDHTSDATIIDTLDLPERAKHDLPRVVNRLLGETFLYQDVDGDKDDYYFVHRHQAVVEQVLNAAGFELLHDDFHRIFQAASLFGYCRARYKLDESLMIVVLRKLYEDHAERLSLVNDPIVTIGEVRDEYRAITGKQRDLGIGQYEDLLKRMRTVGLIETLDGRTIDARESEARLRLRGSVRMILPVKTAEELEAWLRKYGKSTTAQTQGDGDGEEEPAKTSEE